MELKLVKKIVSGNQAISIGAYKGNARFGCGYPGTPSSEILEHFKNYPDVMAQWASNEKVAVEEALGASIAGLRSFATMKHVGLNVAADPLMTASYTGVNAGFVIVTADDPGMHSSQNEQDNRRYAKFAKIPLIEPSDPFEAMGLMQYSFVVSEKFDTPVLFRSTTRISHSLSVVQFDPRTLDNEQELTLQKDFKKYVMIPANAIERHKVVLDRLEKLREFTNTTPINRIEKGSTDIGIITGSMAYNYVKEILPDAHVFKVGMSYPMPTEKIREFVNQFDKVIVVEELEPFMEEELKIAGIDVEGKKYFPYNGEFNLDIIEEGLYKAGILKNKSSVVFDEIDLPKRPPALCPGCPHRPIFDVLHSRKDVFITGDIGCYTLGSLPPLSAMHTTVCMGASISMAIGAAKAQNKDKIVAVIGDSTFFHTGIQPLVDAYLSDISMTVIILDNRITAMTGGQPDPGSGFKLTGEPAKRVSIADIAKAIGIERVFEIDQYDYENTKKLINDEIDKPGLSVIIPTRPCVLEPKKIKERPLKVVEDKCVGCKRCIRIGCPAISFVNNKAIIDAQMCTGCDLCMNVCPVDGAIVPLEEQ
ncbi:indolepyruvate ferredoxin oxidoreductase subunit alpha [Hippea jasoniae]|uniref:indolepyruvate ferredoxin oxidoreductase subunit alpha n=1 Tax=Hippea jasoniae TaxID=944479 RepID=UPI000551C307|nr:indolepyruvate ferredoxin oxidoreductase subunit alpha [Hippea jasoniae]